MSHFPDNEVITRFVVDDFPTLNGSERQELMNDPEKRHRLADLFVNGLSQWDEVAETAVEIAREEGTL